MKQYLKCLVDGCNKNVTGLACDDPQHQAAAATAIGEGNGGIPFVETTALPGGVSVVENHLIERPLGMDMPIAAWNGN